MEESSLMQVNSMNKFLAYEESSGKSNRNRSTRLVSCGYELNLSAYTMSMLCCR